MSASELMPILYVGQHESNRAEPVTDHVLRQAQDCNASSNSGREEIRQLISLSTIRSRPL